MISYVEEIPPAINSVGVNSKEKLFKLMLEFKEVFFIILTATISKTLFVHFDKCCRSSSFLFNEQAFMWNRDNDFFFSGNF